MAPEIHQILSYLFWILVFFLVVLIVIGILINRFLKREYPGYDEYSPLHWARTTPKHSLWVKLWQISTFIVTFSIIAIMILLDSN